MAQYFLKDIIRYNSSTRGWNATDYSLTPSSPTVNEGVACTFTFRAFGFKQGTELSWSVVDSTGLTPGRFDNSEGTVILNSNSVGTFTITVSADQLTASGTQEYTVGIAYGMDTIATADVVVTDSSTRSPGLLVDWYGTSSVIVPTGTYTQDGDATVLDPNTYVDIGQSLTSNQFTITIDADLGRNWNGSTWDTIWAQEAYSGDGNGNSGVFAYFTGDSISYGKPGFSQEAYMGDNDLYYAGRTLYTFVFDGADQRVYIDGEGPIPNNIVSTPADFTFPLNSTFLIGARHDPDGSGGGNDCQGGTYYSVKVEATVKTDQQVLDDFDAWWSEVSITTPIIDINCQAPGALDDPGGTLVLDTSGDYLNAMLFSNNSSVAINDSTLPYSIDVGNYGGNYVYLGQDWLPWTAGEPFTIHIWFKTDINAYGPLFMQTNSSDPFSSDSYVPAIYIDTGGFLHTSTFYHPPANPTVTTAQVNTGGWFLVSVVYDNGDQKTYINGVINGTGLGGVTQSSYSASYHYFLAGGNTTNWPSDPGNSVLGCSIGQFKAYGYAQTSTDMLAFYNNTKRLYLRQFTAYISGFGVNQQWLLPLVAGNPDLSLVTTGWTVSGPSGYTATVVSNANNGNNWVITVDNTPTEESGDYTFSAP